MPHLVLDSPETKKPRLVLDEPVKKLRLVPDEPPKEIGTPRLVLDDEQSIQKETSQLKPAKTDPYKGMRGSYDLMTGGAGAKQEQVLTDEQPQIGAYEPTFKQKIADFFRSGDNLPANADPIEKIHSAIGKITRPLIKFAIGKTLKTPAIGWATIKKVAGDNIPEEVQSMNLEQAMDWAAGYNPSGFEKAVGNLAEFTGGISTAKGILPSSQAKTVLDKAGQAALEFGTAAAGKELSKGIAGAIDPEADYEYGGSAAITQDALIGAVFSLAGSGLKGLWAKLKPTEQSEALKVLGLKDGASEADIRKASRRLAMKYHPDKVKGMEDKFKAVMRARDEALAKPNSGIIYNKQKPKLLIGEHGSAEKESDVIAQFRDMVNPETSRDSVFVGKLTNDPVQNVPEGVTAIKTKDGTLYTTNPEKAAMYAQEPSDKARAGALGYDQTKAEIIDEAIKTGDIGKATVVVAADENGNRVFEELTTQPEKVISKYQKQGYHVSTESPIDTQANRAGIEPDKRGPQLTPDVQTPEVKANGVGVEENGLAAKQGESNSWKLSDSELEAVQRSIDGGQNIVHARDIPDITKKEEVPGESGTTDEQLGSQPVSSTSTNSMQNKQPVVQEKNAAKTGILAGAEPMVEKARKIADRTGKNRYVVRTQNGKFQIRQQPPKNLVYLTIEPEVKGKALKISPKIKKAVFVEVENDPIYQTEFEAQDIRSSEVDVGKYYVPKKFKGEVDIAIENDPSLRFYITYNPQKGAHFDTAVQDGLWDKTGGSHGNMDITEFLERLTEAKRGRRKIGGISEILLDKMIASGDPYSEVTAVKHTMIHEGFTVDEINEAISEIASDNNIDAEPLLLKGQTNVKESTGVSQKTQGKKGQTQTKNQTRQTDLLGREELQGGVSGKQQHFLNPEDYKTTQEKERINGENDAKGQLKLPEKDEYKGSGSVTLNSGINPGIDKFIAEDIIPAIETIKQTVPKIKEIGKAAMDLFLNVAEPSLRVERKSPEAYSAAIRGTFGKAEARLLDFDQQRIDSYDATAEELKQWFDKFSKKDQRNFMMTIGRAGTPEAQRLQKEAYEKLPKELKDAKLKEAFRAISDNNFLYLKNVMKKVSPAKQINYFKEYFYGVYKNPEKIALQMAKADNIKTTKRFIKFKTIPSVADAINYGAELKHDNPIDNLRAEFAGIARLESMNWMKKEMLQLGKYNGETNTGYIAEFGDAPIEWAKDGKVDEPVLEGYLFDPDLARLINNLISTNKVTQNKLGKTFWYMGNGQRILKFAFSAFHNIVISKQAVADSGWFGFLNPGKWVNKKYGKIKMGTALRGLEAFGSKKYTQRIKKTFESSEYKYYIERVGGHQFSQEAVAIKMFRSALKKIERSNFIGGTLHGTGGIASLPGTYSNWLFNTYIPYVKFTKHLDNVAAMENKLGRKLTDAEYINIAKEGQNFYGEMNERLFGRSGTVTSLMRLLYITPGYSEGNLRTILKAFTQWGYKGGWNANRSRANIFMSLTLSAITAAILGRILSGQWPDPPEKLEDVPDTLFKAKTPWKDKQGRRIYVDTLTYDKDYWEVLWHLIDGRPDKAGSFMVRRYGGMKTTLAHIATDLANMAVGNKIYDWKGDPVAEVTDSAAEKFGKFFNRWGNTTQPISYSVFKRAFGKGAPFWVALGQATVGMKITMNEEDKRKQNALQRIYSLKGQQEETYLSLPTSNNPRARVAAYNNKVIDVMAGKLMPAEYRDKWQEKLIIDIDRYLQNKAYQASVASNTEASEKQAEKAISILNNFDINSKQAEKLLDDYYGRTKTKVSVSPLERNMVIGRSLKKKRLIERLTGSEEANGTK